jgi:hypothetical protein
MNSTNVMLYKISTQEREIYSRTMGTVNRFLAMFVLLYFKHLKMVSERLHLMFEWKNSTCQKMMLQ